MDKDSDDDLVGQTLVRIRVREIRRYCADLLDQFENPELARDEDASKSPPGKSLKRSQT